jgi:hypothetical protein
LEEEMPTHNGPGYKPPARQTQITSNILVNNYPWTSEDNNNAQHIANGEYAPDYGSIAIDLSETSPLGAPLFFTVQAAGGRNPAIDGYINSVTLSPNTIDGLPPCGGTFFDDQGNPLTEGLVKIDDDGNVYTVSINDSEYTITVDSTNSSWKPVNLDGFGGLHYVPAIPDSDLDINIRFSVFLESKVSNRVITKEIAGSIFVTVDAVADLPEYHGGAETAVFFEPSDSENPYLSPATVYENGIASQTIGGATLGVEKHAMVSLGKATFRDFADGSEEHFLLLSCKDGDLQWTLDTALFGTAGYEAFLPPENGILDSFWLYNDNTEAAPGADGAVMHYKIVVDNGYLSQHNGEVGLGLPLIVGEESEGGSYHANRSHQHHPLLSGGGRRNRGATGDSDYPPAPGRHQ